MELFGIEIKRKKDSEKSGKTFAPPTQSDGAIEIETTEGGVNFAQQNGYAFDLDAMPTDEFDLLLTYRSLALQQEIDEAVQEIVNEAIITDDMKQSVAVILDDVDLSEGIKSKIRDEFDYIMKLLKFKTEGYGVFRKWYVDGRLYYHKVVDETSAKKGIVELIPIDPINIKLIREIKKSKEGQTDVYDLADIEEYFLYSRRPFMEIKAGDRTTQQSSNQQGLRIPKEAVTHVPSGLLSADAKLVLSYLYKAIKPFNNVKLMEDSVVIYRVTRAPERRIFYVDVGNLPKGKAEQYLKDIMNRFRNKVVYDVNKGTINNRKKYQTMMEDFWLPRREGGRGTEVSTLPGGQNLGELEDVEYFKNKLYRSLNVPLSRFMQEGGAFNIGRTTEITRDEIKFSKFISRLRKKFAGLFDDLLKTQLILKNIITVEEWDEIEQSISYDFLEDNYFQELKELEVNNDRIEALSNIVNSGAIGKYISHDYVRKNILRQTEDEIEEEDKKIAEEEKDPKYKEEGDDDFGGGDDIGNGGGFGNQPQDEPDPQNVADDKEDDEEREDKVEKEKDEEEAESKKAKAKPKTKESK